MVELDFRPVMAEVAARSFMEDLRSLYSGMVTIASQPLASLNPREIGGLRFFAWKLGIPEALALGPREGERLHQQVLSFVHAPSEASMKIVFSAAREHPARLTALPPKDTSFPGNMVFVEKAQQILQEELAYLVALSPADLRTRAEILQIGDLPLDNNSLLNYVTAVLHHVTGDLASPRENLDTLLSTVLPIAPRLTEKGWVVNAEPPQDYTRALHKSQRREQFHINTMANFPPLSQQQRQRAEAALAGQDSLAIFGAAKGLGWTAPRKIRPIIVDEHSLDLSPLVPYAIAYLQTRLDPENF